MAIEPAPVLADQVIHDDLAGTAVTPSGGEATSTGGLLLQVVRGFLENKLAVLGLVIIVAMVVLCFLGPLFYHSNQTNESLILINSTPNLAPGSGHPLGTDGSGFDMLGRIMYGGQVSLEVGFAAAAIATALGVLWGATAGFIGGAVDAFMMRIVDVLLAIPVLFLLITLTVIFQSSLGLIIIVIGFVSWLTPARLVRGETLTLRVREYVQAVRVMGGTGKRIVLRHIVPNTIGTIIVNATFQVADAILYLAALGFIGLGVPSPLADWGSMLSVGVGYADVGDWWEIHPTGLAIVLVVVSLNFVGDALRDAFEVRLQRR